MLCRMVVMVVESIVAGGVLLSRFAGAVDVTNEQSAKPLRAGIIGLDTSHVVAFTQLLNATSPKPELAGVRVVAAYPGGSLDIPSSRNRLAGYTTELRDKFGVKIVESIDALLAGVDVVLLESVDGRPHLEQARPVFRRVNRCSSISRWLDLLPMRSRSSSWHGRRTPLVFRAPRSGSARVLPQCGITPRSAMCLAAMRMARALSKSTILTCSGTASTALKHFSR